LNIQSCAENGDIVRRSEVLGKEVNVIENPQSPLRIPQATRAKLPENNIDEILIAEVYSREPLWNQSIAIAQRDRRTVDRLWQEVSDATEGIYNIIISLQNVSLYDTQKYYKNIIKTLFSQEYTP